MNEFETFYRQQIERLERELKRASDKERESIERELAVYRQQVEKRSGKIRQKRTTKWRTSATMRSLFCGIGVTTD